MTITELKWHKRYKQQAGWTKQIRTYLYERAGFIYSKRILDVGCGTGVLESELASTTDALIFGIDIDPVSLKFAKDRSPKALYARGDANLLPYGKFTFDITFCHFLLLWVTNPGKVCDEMVRVTSPGGAVILFAEPDYGGRIDYPPDLEQVGELQVQSLRNQGADPFMGRKLAGLLSSSGLREIEYGVLGGQWELSNRSDEPNSEWEIISADLAHIDVDPLLVERLRDIETSAWRTNNRILYVSTFYAWGRVPS